MIPVLYEKTEKQMKNWGLGQITDCQKAVVTEELNGDFTAEMVVPYTSPVYPLLMVDRIVGLHVPRRAVGGVWEGGTQPFRIVSVSKPMAGLVTVKMEHVSAQLKKVIMKRWVPSSSQYISGNFKALPHEGSLDDFSFAFNITGFDPTSHTVGLLHHLLFSYQRKYGAVSGRASGYAAGGGRYMCRHYLYFRYS